MSLHLLLQLVRVVLQEHLLLVLDIQIPLSLHGLDTLDLKRGKVVFPLWLGGDQGGAVDVARDEILMPPPTLLEGVGITGLDGLLELRDERGLVLNRHTLVMNDILH